MTNAQKCPVCEGKGLVANPFGDKKCHGCGGKGWVEVGGITPTFWPMYIEDSRVHRSPPGTIIWM